MLRLHIMRAALISTLPGLLLTGCGDGEAANPTDASLPGRDAGNGDAGTPVAEPSDPCLMAGYHFDGESDCDVVRCPELTCTCSETPDAGGSAPPVVHTLGACVPGAGCLHLVDCERVCDPTRTLVREACEQRMAGAEVPGCAADDECAGECRNESVGSLCVDSFQCAESGHCSTGSQCLFDPVALDEDTEQPRSLGDCSDGSQGSRCFEDGDCQPGRCAAGWCTGGLQGERCSKAEHCASGYCRESATGDGEGVCVSGQQGGACSDAGDCAEGLHCTQETCHSSEVGARCDTGSQCDTGICVHDLCRSGELGAHCAEPSDCQGGFCVSGRCTSGGLLAPCREAGDCGDGVDCVRRHCSDGSEGMPCTSVDDCSVRACVRSVCSEGADGATCLTDDQCMSNRCANPAGAEPGECTSGAPGSICITGTHCVSGSCASGACE